MMRRHASRDDTGAYSAAVQVGGGLLFVSGHGPLRAGEVVTGTIEEQTALTLANIVETIDAAGGSRESIVRCGCFLADIGDFDRFDAAYREFFGSALPTRTTVGAALGAGMKVEIEAVAALER